MKKFLAYIVREQLRRAITLGTGVLVGAGLLSAEDADALTTGLTALLVQFLLTVGYAAFDRYVQPKLEEFLKKGSE